MTATVLAFVEDGLTASPVISTARVLSTLLSASVEAIHIGEEVSPDIRETSHAAQVPLRVEPGDPIEQIVAAMSPDRVVAGVVGARGDPAGPRPVGSTALEVITRVDKLVAVVPPDSAVPSQGGLGRILIPLNGTKASAGAVEVLSEACARGGVEILVLHVFDRSTTPAFWDQPFHETEAFEEEFLARFMTQPGVRMSLRTGAPREGVLDVAVRESVDVIALGWSQRLDPGRAEVVRHVLAEARIPVLLVPSE